MTESCSTCCSRHSWPVSRAIRIGLLALALLLQACGLSPYRPAELESATFLQRAQTQTDGDITVRAALPDATETIALTGLDLYEQGIQPLWIEVVNRGSEPLRATLWSIDRDYFSPIEVAYMNRRSYSGQGYRSMEQWFHENSLPRRIPPGESRSGLVFTNLRPGTKGFNFDLFGPRSAVTFTFFLALPGFVPDYMAVDFRNLYPPEEIAHYSQRQLLELLSDRLPCCATDESGALLGGPLNVVMVSTAEALRRALMRGEWLETSTEAREKLRNRQHFFQGRNPDGRFYLDRDDGDVRLVLNIWLGPWRVEGRPVWVAQTYYRERTLPVVASLQELDVVEKSKLLAKFVGESVFADIDSARSFALQNFWYNQSLEQLGMVPGVGSRDIDSPAETYDGRGYFTDGYRAVMFVSDTPVAMGETRLLDSVDPPLQPAARPGR